MKITYVFPSRSRPTKFFETLDNITLLSAKPDFQIITTLDTDDSEMCKPGMMDAIAKYEKVTAIWSKSYGKVNAINRDVKHIPEDTSIVILMSDDQKFTCWGFDEIIRIDMQENFPDLDGVLHYNDGTPAADRMITMSIMGFNYFKRFNYLYSPAYKSVYCDNEFTEVARMLKKYKYISRQGIYEHKHPAWGTAPNDELYKINEEPVSYQIDKETYFKRLSKNFDCQ